MRRNVNLSFVEDPLSLGCQVHDGETHFTLSQFSINMQLLLNIVLLFASFQLIYAALVLEKEITVSAFYSYFSHCP